MKFNLPNNNGKLPTDQHRALKNYRLMQWAKVATFGLYMVAVFMLYVSDVWGVASFVTKNSNEFIALSVFSIISFVLAFFLASSKEAVYEDIALHRSEGWKLKPTQYAAMGLFLSSGILFEMFSTTNNQQHIANTAAEQSTMMKSIQGTDVSLLGSANLTDSFASAKMKLAQCEARLAQGKEKHCDGAKARVDAVRESMTMANQLATTAAQQSVDNKVDGMLKIREHFDKPMFQAIGKATGTDNNSGMLMVIGVLIFIFECQHIMALFAYANSLARINRKVGNAGSNDNAGYASPTPFGTAPISGFANAAKQTVGEYAAKVEAGLKASPEIIATEYARADYANKQVLADAANMAEKIGDKVNEMAGKPSQVVMNNALRDIRTKILDSELQPTPEALYPMLKSMLHEQGFETPKKAVLKIATAMLEHLAVKDNVLVKNGNGYQLASRWTASSFAPESSSVSALHDGALYPPAPLIETDSFKQSPEQLAFVKSEYAKQMQEYERAKLSALSGENTVRYLTGNPVTTVPAQPEQTRTEAQPEQHEQPVTTVPAQSEQHEAAELTGSAKQAETDLYPQWLALVQSKEMTAGARDAKRFISQTTKNGSDKTGLTIQEMGRIWLNWQDRAARDGALKANPKYQPNNRQPKYLLAA